MFQLDEEKQSNPWPGIVTAVYVVIVFVGLLLVFDDVLSFPSPISSSLALFIALSTVYPIGIRGRKNGLTRGKKNWNVVSWLGFSLALAVFDFLITFFLF